MTRDKAYQLLTKYLHNKNLVKHCLAAEVAMKALCKRLHPEIFANEEKSADAKALADKWGITGLLHDVDYEVAQKENRLSEHGILIKKLEPNSIPQEIMHAINAHNFENTKVMPENHMDWAITCVDQLTGLIVAAALVHPEKKLAPLTVEFIENRFGEKSFARGANRQMISYCWEKLGIPLPEFIDITLSAMKAIHIDLGL